MSNFHADSTGLTSTFNVFTYTWCPTNVLSRSTFVLPRLP